MARKKKPKPLFFTPRKDVGNEPQLPSVRPAEPKPEGSVLPDPRQAEDSGNGSGGIFGPEADKPTDRVEPSARSSESTDANLTDLLKQVLLEMAGPKYQEAIGRPISNLEVIARGMVDDAMRGDKQMREMVIERVEGKAVRAAQVQPADTTLEEQLDRASINALNEMAEKKEPENA